MTTPVKNYSFFVYVQIAPFSFLHYLFSKIFQDLPLNRYKDLRESTFDTDVENNRQTTKVHRAKSIPTHDQVDFVCDDRDRT